MGAATRRTAGQVAASPRIRADRRGSIPRRDGDACEARRAQWRVQAIHSRSSSERLGRVAPLHGRGYRNLRRRLPGQLVLLHGDACAVRCLTHVDVGERSRSHEIRREPLSHAPMLDPGRTRKENRVLVIHDHAWDMRTREMRCEIARGMGSCAGDMPTHAHICDLAAEWEKGECALSLALALYLGSISFSVHRKFAFCYMYNN